MVGSNLGRSGNAMPIHVGELTSNVTVMRAASSQPGPTVPATAAVVPAAEALPPTEMVLSQTTAGPEASGTVAEEDRRTRDAHDASAPVVDPKALADRVYRIMRDDLIIARERE
jgi:hypothetical protein